MDVDVEEIGRNVQGDCCVHCTAFSSKIMDMKMIVSISSTKNGN